MSDKRRTFAVIDGNSLMHRAFHAVPPTMNAPDGRPTNAIFGFLNMFLKMIDAFNPDGVVVAFDKGKPRVRMEMLPQYKAQRPPMDPDLHAQFPMIKELLAALNVPILQSEGWEGDDILGTMARLGEQAGCDMLLVTGDRDMYQLVTEHVNVVSTPLRCCCGCRASAPKRRARSLRSTVAWTRSSHMPTRSRAKWAKTCARTSTTRC